MNTEQKKLFEQIAHCGIADKILDDLLNGDPNTHPCREICAYQQTKISNIGDEIGSEYQVQFSKETFHAPEPWNGNLEEAEILFVSSNPSFSEYETTPELAELEGKEVLPKFDSPEWPLNKAQEFFEDRFKHEEYWNKTWEGILKYAGYILEKTKSIESINNINDEKKKDIASSIALTEVVHCKSEKEIGVNGKVEVKEADGKVEVKKVPEVKEYAKSLVPCYFQHTKAVIELFLKSPSEKTKKVVITGSEARNIFQIALALKDEKDDIPKPKQLEELAPKNKLEKVAQKEFGELGQNARFIFIPHPNAQNWKSWKVPKSYKSLSDEVRQQIIYDELKGCG